MKAKTQRARRRQRKAAFRRPVGSIGRGLGLRDWPPAASMSMAGQGPKLPRSLQALKRSLGDGLPVMDARVTVANVPADLARRSCQAGSRLRDLARLRGQRAPPHRPSHRQEDLGQALTGGHPGTRQHQARGRPCTPHGSVHPCHHPCRSGRCNTVGPGRPQRRYSRGAGIGRSARLRCRSTPQEVDAILEAASGDRLGAFYTVALAVGLRPSEALGLKWADIDFAAGTATGRAGTGAAREYLVLQGAQISDQPADDHLCPRVCAEQLDGPPPPPTLRATERRGVGGQRLGVLHAHRDAPGSQRGLPALLEAPGASRRGAPPALRLPAHGRQLPARPRASRPEW